MKLIVWFGGLGMRLDESLYFLQLTLISSLKPWRVMEDELRVALKEEWAININGYHTDQRQGQIIEFSDKSKIITADVGSS